ncbi:5-formyltetrahydrofolate cyclo-ligase [Companilactobacillus futsaii]|uniref:5-formyltetrahydrofolate cyclo-ligase n=2 Tax=Companilactobacillus futsaii TaxID=938155 RepID=A0A5B7T5T8_9LACO|nr:5-formyltetrahydrofolate cyclo-ligase [Companilactobacillus futsaii]KRK95085.1 5-formyltetrahydrofolate cyclo-ligase [Companilactobacillus futsaii JCM 17355]QCX25762.1 5-formyltetrahydrofolate cyclo-ligase [Companilactobacillus futsaii]
MRQQQIQKLKQNQAQTKIEGIKLLKQLVELPEWKNAKSIATTASSPIEVPTEPIIQAAQGAGKKVYLPKTMPHRQMAFLPFTSSDDLVVSKFGIPEPEYKEELVNQAPDLVIVPGLAFAKDSNYRVGFGGGYYDRFLAKYPGKTVTLVPSVMLFETADWEIDEFDIKIQRLLTV